MGGASAHGHFGGSGGRVLAWSPVLAGSDEGKVLNPGSDAGVCSRGGSRG